MFGLFKKDRDTTQIDNLLAEIERLGRRMGALSVMEKEKRDGIIRFYKLNLIIDNVRLWKPILLEAHDKVSNGKIGLKEIRTELDECSASLFESHRFLDTMNAMGNEPNEYFIERDGIGSFFDAPNP